VQVREGLRGLQGESGMTATVGHAGHRVKPHIPEVIERFVAYYQAKGDGAWGSLHIVLEDGNVLDSNVAFCRDYAARQGDTEGRALAEILLRMTRSQRGRLTRKVREWIADNPPEKKEGNPA